MRFLCVPEFFLCSVHLSSSACCLQFFFFAQSPCVVKVDPHLATPLF